MRVLKTIILGLLFIVCFVACDCIIEPYGKVIDSETKLPIGEVKVIVDYDEDHYFYTDSLGNYSLSQITGCSCKCATISFEKEGYNKITQEFNTSSSDDITIMLYPINSKANIKLKSWNCKKGTGNCTDESNFLSDFIQYGNIKIDSTKLKDIGYYKSFILKSFPSEYFDKDNFIFGKSVENIKEYGKCYIGEFKFINHNGVDQERVYVMLNPFKDEVYVFYFDKIVIEKNSTIKLYFNTRGKVSQRNIKYSPKDKSFVLDCNSIK